MKTKYSLDQFLDLCRERHGDTYDYSLVGDACLNKKHIFVCTVHGEFFQYGFHHLAGSGCKECGIAARSTGNYGRVTFDCLTHGPQECSAYLFRSHDGSPPCVSCNQVSKTEDFKSYRRACRVLSEKWFREQPFLIDPDPLSKPRGITRYHLDHIYSVKDGFINEVPVEIVSHWSNLMLIPYRHNIAKSNTSWRSLDQLHELYTIWVEYV